MIRKALRTASFTALIAFSVGACAQTTPAMFKPPLAVLAEEVPPSEAPVDVFALQGTWTGTATLLREVDPRGAENSDPCSQQLRLTWTVNATEITGSSLMVALQGALKGTATLLRDVNPKGVKPTCSEKMSVAWVVNGTDITGSTVSANNSKARLSGSVGVDGRWEVVRTIPSGYKRHMSGWFNGDRSIGFMRAGISGDYCDFRVDMTKAA